MWSTDPVTDERQRIVEDGQAGGQPRDNQAFQPSGGLVVEAEAKRGDSEDSFSEKLEATLRQTAQEVCHYTGLDAAEANVSWEFARSVVQEFQPVPFFIWRMSNFVLGNSEEAHRLNEGLLFGMRRLVFAVASDPVMGDGQKVKNVRKALELVSSDVIASASVIYAMNRRLQTCDFERIWRPILEDAILRARIGFEVGSKQQNFGAGRGMLAGFAGRIGLAILIAKGKLEQAQQALERLATGIPIKEVGMDIYGCDPLQVSAFALSAAGCGRDAALGTAGYSAGEMFGSEKAQGSQLSWFAAFTICEKVRIGRAEDIQDRFWQALGFLDDDARNTLVGNVKNMIRRGHGWNWLLG